MNPEYQAPPDGMKLSITRCQCSNALFLLTICRRRAIGGREPGEGVTRLHSKRRQDLIKRGMTACS